MKPLREFAGSFLEPDEHADPKRNCEYDVYSLYLDSPSYTTCRATMRGLKNRFKLRIRFYDFSPDSPVFFEIKRRVSDVILKRRARVRRAVVGELLAGHWPELGHLAEGYGPNDFGDLQQFCGLRDVLQADGKTFVAYAREAYVTPNDDSVRVTFDRGIHGIAYRDGLSFRENEARYPRIGGVVLELKFTDRFPNWMREMVEVFDLERRSMAKYVSCVLCMAGRPLRPAVTQQEVISHE